MASESSALESPEELGYTSESGSDYEPQTKTSKRRKRAVPAPPPPKRSKHNAALGVTSSRSLIPSPPDPSLQQQPPSQGSSMQVSLRPVESVNNGSQGISAETLYDAVSSGKSAMVTVVEEWLDSYIQSREAGLLVLINFIVKSCGCKGVVTREMLENMENAEIISILTKEFSEDSVNYPLSTRGLQLKRFKASLCEFSRVLVRSCRNNLIYDEYLFPSLLALLTGMSDSQVRAFRHTSTMLAMKLMTGLVEVAVLVSVQLQTTQRQYDTENSKSPDDRSTDRLEKLQATLSQLQENREELSSMMNATFRGVFVHRYRDRLPEIRSVCIEELGLWMKTDPEDFLSDGCLKYLGWTLYDKQSPVRLQCVRALQGLYQEKEFIGRLELFTSRFKERILCMSLDKDQDVAVEVVYLLLTIIQVADETLNEEECGCIYPFVYASHRGLASAAGAFLYKKLKSGISTDNQEDERSNNAAFFHMLISFCINSKLHEHGTYVVDSLWAVAGSELRDWDTMTQLLLHDTGLTYEEEGVMLEIMMCAVRQAAQTTPPVGRGQGKKMLSLKDKKIQEQDRGHITAHFIPILPQLLTKYSADAGKVSLLLKAPLYFDLDMYSNTQWLEKIWQLSHALCCKFAPSNSSAGSGKAIEIRKWGPRTINLEQHPGGVNGQLIKTVPKHHVTLMKAGDSTETCQHLDLLLSQICVIVKKDTDANVLQACAHLVSTLCTESYTFSSRAHLAFNQLLDDLTDCFSTYSTNLMQRTANEDDIYDTASALKRIAALSSAKDLTGWKLFDPCLGLLKNRMESMELHTELMVSALKCAAFHLMWAKVNVVNSRPSEVELKRLKKEVHLFCRVCQTCLSVDEAEIRDQAFELLCDLLLLYSVTSVHSEPVLQELVHLPSDSLRSELAAFLLDYIFTEADDVEHSDDGDAEMKITLLQRRRNQLAGYCKLVIYRVLDLSAATNVFKHYSKHFKYFGDIIKDTLSKSRLINAVQSAKTVCLCLQQLFSEMLTENHSQQALSGIRELAKKLAMSFGIDLHRIRKPLVTLHMDGIHFAFRSPQEGEEQHPNVVFLEILSEFSFKLLQQDRTTLAAFMKSECPTTALSCPSVRLYQCSLENRSMSKFQEQQMGGDVASSHDTPVAKRKKTTAQGSAASTTEGSWLESSSVHSHLPTPALTSTVQKQPANQPASRKQRATESDIHSALTELESEDEFSVGSQMRKVKPVNRSKLSAIQSPASLEQEYLYSELNMLSLFEDELSEMEEENVSGGVEPGIEEYESDSESGYTLPSTRHTSASILDELFD